MLFVLPALLQKLVGEFLNLFARKFGGKLGEFCGILSDTQNNNFRERIRSPIKKIVPKFALQASHLNSLFSSKRAAENNRKSNIY